MHENNKKCDANEAKPKKRAKEIKITAGRGCSSNQGVQEQNKSGIGPRKGKRHAVGPKGVQTGSKAEISSKTSEIDQIKLRTNVGPNDTCQ